MDVFVLSPSRKKGMDVHVTSPSSNKQELRENQGIDLISNLPDHILHHVFSFLSTKDVIQTSILSRRWQYLWTSVANIELEYKPFWRITDMTRSAILENNFLEFVDRVFALHDASDIKRLRLNLSLPDNFPRLNLWLSNALNHNVQELDLCLNWNEQYVLPGSLFTCRTLTVLKISARFTVEGPPSTCFLNLKKLYLARITFSDDLSTQRIFSSCPILEELALVHCNWKNIENVTISIPSLRSLTIADYYEAEAVLGCLIKISSNNITYLHCSSDLKVRIYMCDLPSLDKACVDISDPEVQMDGFAYRAQRLFSAIYNVKILRITRDALWSILEVENLLNHIPTFNNLTHLEVGPETWSCYIRLMKFLQKTPNLENLNLFLNAEADFDVIDGQMREKVPSCFNSSLKIISISFFDGNSADMELLRFVLKNAIVLQSMIIFCFKKLAKDRKWLKMVYNKLNLLPKASKSCVIELRETL